MYLLPSDFKKSIQSDNLNQITGNDTSVLNAAMQMAEEEVISYLVQKYDTSAEFDDTTVWNANKTYNGGDRVYLDALAYDATATYNLNTLALQNGSVYICTTGITAAEAFNAAHWTLLGKQNDLFYGKNPYPAFQFNTGVYKVGDEVYYKGKTYTALQPSYSEDYDQIIQQDYMPVANYANYFPDDPNYGATYWGAGTPFTIPAGTLPTNTTYWVTGDNRSQQILTYMVDIALYQIHSRIAPRNIPDLRVKRYDEAMKWLKSAAKGDITPNLPVLQPASGSRIRWASRPKQRNDY